MKKRKEKKQGQSNKSRVMSFIALTVTFLAVLGTVFLALLYSKSEHAAENISQILLPLWSTWFGTILAYYFSKENLDAARDSTQSLLEQLSAKDQQFASKPVRTAMLPFAEIKALNIKENGKELLIKIVNNQEYKEFHRFPVFDDKQLVYMIHRSVILQYLCDSTQGIRSEKTLNDFLETMEIQIALKDSVGFVSETATLLDAKNEMDKRKNCEDVFVTKDGKNSSDVIGWVRDRDIYKYGRA